MSVTREKAFSKPGDQLLQPRPRPFPWGAPGHLSSSPRSGSGCRLFVPAFPAGEQLPREPAPPDLSLPDLRLTDQSPPGDGTWNSRWAGRTQPPSTIVLEMVVGSRRGTLIPLCAQGTAGMLHSPHPIIPQVLCLEVGGWDLRRGCVGTSPK